MPETSEVENKSSADFGRRGTILTLPQGGNELGTVGTTFPSKESGKPSDIHDVQSNNVFFSPWTICH